MNLPAGRGDTPLTNQEIETFRADGAVCLAGRFDERWIEILRQGVDRNLANPSPVATEHDPGGKEGRFFEDYCNWQRIPEFGEFVLDSPAARYAGELTGSTSVQIFHDHLLVKEPGTGKPTPWHHDMPYYCVEGSQVASIWLALDNVSLEVCPQFIAGSHNWGRRFYPRLFETGNNYDYGNHDFETVPDIDADRDTYRILSWDLRAGDAIAFHFLTVHGAPGNRSTRRRRGFATRWLGDDASFAARPGATSPPYPGIGLKPGDRMREDWFPVVWTADAQAAKPPDGANRKERG